MELLPVRGRTNHGRARHFARQLQARLAEGAPDRVLGFDKLPGLDLYFAADPCFVDRAHHRRGPLYRLTPRYRTFAALEGAVFAPQVTTRILLLDPRQRAVYRRWYGTGEDRFVQLPPGTARDRRAGPDAGVLRDRGRAEFGLADDESLVPLLGSDFRRKGLDRAIRALAHLPQAQRRRTRLLAVGQDDPRSVSALARRLGVADRLLVRSGRDDVPVLLQAADLLIHPARGGEHRDRRRPRRWFARPAACSAPTRRRPRPACPRLRRRPRAAGTLSLSRIRRAPWPDCSPPTGAARARALDYAGASTSTRCTSGSRGGRRRPVPGRAADASRSRLHA
ncbi:MAG: glycosyltransferase [Gammaproteobacteria bacterium]|nr:glycosyltransferase [Gammaproteobacteria bacterium]